MADETFPKEVIYIANCSKKRVPGDNPVNGPNELPDYQRPRGDHPKEVRFAVHHTYVHNDKSGGTDVFDYNMSRERMIGYLDGATAIRVPRGHVKQVVNGIPESVRGGFFPDLDIESLAGADFVTICEKANLGSRVRSEFVKISPLGTN